MVEINSEIMLEINSERHFVFYRAKAVQIVIYHRKKQCSGYLHTIGHNAIRDECVGYRVMGWFLILEDEKKTTTCLGWSRSFQFVAVTITE